jgi:hypothetical protein
VLAVARTVAVEAVSSSAPSAVDRRPARPARLTLDER